MGRFDPDAPVSDIVHSANSLIRQHGQDAVLVAEMRADQSLGRGDIDGYRTWKRIELVVDGLSGGYDGQSACH